MQPRYGPLTGITPRSCGALRRRRRAGSKRSFITEFYIAVGVSHSTLRACAERVSKWARKGVLCELGLFAVAYRSLFGEAPSTALRRSPDGVKPELRRPP